MFALVSDKVSLTRSPCWNVTSSISQSLSSCSFATFKSASSCSLVMLRIAALLSLSRPLCLQLRHRRLRVTQFFLDPSYFRFQLRILRISFEFGLRMSQPRRRLDDNHPCLTDPRLRHIGPAAGIDQCFLQLLEPCNLRTHLFEC